MHRFITTVLFWERFWCLSSVFTAPKRSEYKQWARSWLKHENLHKCSIRKLEQDSCEIVYWVLIWSETEVHRGYSIVVVQNSFTSYANVSIFLEEVSLRMKIWARKMLAISLKIPTKIQVTGFTNDVLCSVNICLLGGGVRPLFLYTLAVEKPSVWENNFCSVP